jgi:hypothetical protein
MSQATNNQQGAAAKRAPPPAFDPERPMLVQPWREFEGRGWLEVQYLGGSITRTVKCKLLGALLTKEELATGTDVFVGPQEAKDRIIRANLWSPGKGKKKGTGEKLVELPKRSICKKDFEGNDESLRSRARSVANTLGERTAAGRIGSMELTRKGRTTFGQWWDGAGADRKARILSDKKHFDSLTKEEKQRLNSVLMDCPFRADEPVPAEKEEEPPAKKEAKASSSKDGKKPASQ